jgi:hypothetical protein
VLVRKQDKVTLYLRAEIPDIDYFDIATELSRFTLEKPNDFVHTIKDRLSSSLRELERRGVPIDLLLKNKQQNQSKLC